MCSHIQAVYVSKSAPINLALFSMKIGSNSVWVTTLDLSAGGHVDKELEGVHHVDVESSLVKMFYYINLSTQHPFIFHMKFIVDTAGIVEIIDSKSVRGVPTRA